MLTPDYQHLAGRNLGLLTDVYLEGGVLFKRSGVYYIMAGSCCCFCRGGSGAVVYSAASLSGPWTRQPSDVNCGSPDVPICGAYGARIAGNITIAAQGIGLSLIPLADGTTLYLWHGERWLSAPDNNPSCPDECRPETGICAEPATYIKGHGFAYWIPLAFNDSAGGAVRQFAPFVSAFEVDLPGTTVSMADALHDAAGGGPGVGSGAGAVRPLH